MYINCTFDSTFSLILCFIASHLIVKKHVQPYIHFLIQSYKRQFTEFKLYSVDDQIHNQSYFMLHFIILLPSNRNSYSSSNVFIPNSDSYQDSVITTINVFLPCGSLWNFVKVPFYCHFSVYFLIPGALILLPKMKQNQILVKYIITELVMVFIAYWNAMFS